MRNRKIQKQIRLQNKSLVQACLDDESEMTGISDSQIIERILLEHYLPTQFRSAIVDLYIEGLSTGDTLVRIWSEAGDMTHGDLRQVVEYAKTETIRTNTYVDPTDHDMPHFLSLLKATVHYLHDERDIRWARELINIYSAKDGPVVLSNVYQILLNNWTDVKDYAKTYNLLQDMASIQPGWITTAETRRELINILKSITKQEKTA